MKPYRYAFDPLCLASCFLYAVNPWCLPLAWKGTFLRNHFNDLLLVPAALPLLLGLHRRLGLRKSDTPPAAGEVLLHWAVWSVAAEVVGPRLFARATGDAWAVVAYGAGALLSAAYWRVS